MRISDGRAAGRTEQAPHGRRRCECFRRCGQPREIAQLDRKPSYKWCAAGSATIRAVAMRNEIGLPAHFIPNGAAKTSTGERFDTRAHDLERALARRPRLDDAPKNTGSITVSTALPLTRFTDQAFAVAFALTA